MATSTANAAAPGNTSPSDAGAARADAARLGTVLGVWAHPDDECYLAAGLVAMAAAAGNRVVVVTATRGERGTADPVTWPPARLARVRTREMTAAMRRLQVDDHRWLDHPDGGCTDLDPAAAAAEIATVVDEVRPDTVVTFGPDGVTGHPDHVAVSGWVSRALGRGRGRPRLLWPATTAARVAQFADALDGVDVWGPDGPPLTVEREVSLRLALPTDALDAKVAALREHESQTSGLIDAMGAVTYREWLSVEEFRDGAPSANGR